MNRKLLAKVKRLIATELNIQNTSFEVGFYMLKDGSFSHVRHERTADYIREIEALNRLADSIVVMPDERDNWFPKNLSLAAPHENEKTKTDSSPTTEGESWSITEGSSSNISHSSGTVIRPDKWTR